MFILIYKTVYLQFKFKLKCYSQKLKLSKTKKIYYSIKYMCNIIYGFRKKDKPFPIPFHQGWTNWSFYRVMRTRRYTRRLLTWSSTTSTQRMKIRPWPLPLISSSSSSFSSSVRLPWRVSNFNTSLHPHLLQEIHPGGWATPPWPNRAKDLTNEHFN